MDVLNRAFKEFFEGNIEGAERLVERLKKRMKKSYRLWLLDSLIKLRKNRLEEALNSINMGLELKDDEAELWVIKGKILMRLGDNNEALKSFEKAYDITLKKDDYMDYEILIDITKSLLALDKIREAKKVFRKVYELVPEDDEIIELKKKFEEFK